MDNLLLKIMVERFEHKVSGNTLPDGHKPFITISREFGCQANMLAVMLKQELDTSSTSWRIMNKEIIQDAARDLHMDPAVINAIAGSSERTQMDEVLHALSSKFYKSDRKIRQTIASVVQSTAGSGHVIIVGRAGAAITRGMSPAIHIHLIAPMEWRLNSLIQRHGITREAAFKQLSETDLKRYKLIRDNVKGGESHENLYDLTLNCSMVSHNEMVKIIMKLAEFRKMI